ncbi:unnamed protein product [Urochloa decumbens]|uniref:Uncharacterized protein n=1 Tax=Urochloa decumbens TaxID=240449 RepID=A0ABC8Y6U2_9POAL
MPELPQVHLRDSPNTPVHQWERLAVGTMMIGRRRFVNMVAENLKSGVCSVHRLNVSEHLFYPSTAEAEAAKSAAVPRLEALPPPATTFRSAPHPRWKGQPFALRTALYDVESSSNYEMPYLSYKGYDPITISIARPDAPEEELYVLSSGPTAASSGFEALTFGRPSNSKVNLFPSHPPEEMWKLESLPRPPLPEASLVCSHAVLHDGRTICVTAAPYGAAGTYLFDTVKHEWTQAPDGWDLPFFGGAEYVPDLKLWLGLAATGDDGHHHLCASDLSAPVEEGKPPTLKHQWQVVEMPEEWQATMVSLINLGEGRFCIFKLIHDHIPGTDRYDAEFSYQGNLRWCLALLTGVEINSSPEHGLRVVPHKSLSYVFTKDTFKCVL